MGGATNIHHATQLFESASRAFASTQAIVQPAGKWIQRVGMVGSQSMVDDYKHMLLFEYLNTWIAVDKPEKDKVRIVDVDIPYSIPAAYISWPFGDLHSGPRDETQLAFAYIVQGKNAGQYSKLGFTETPQEAAVKMLGELLNGYSIVFSAALLKSAGLALRRKTGGIRVRYFFVGQEIQRGLLRNEEVDKIAELEAATLYNGETGELEQVGLLC